jgi:putative transcriptional regulator
MERTYLNGQFLIAMPDLSDPNFYQSVTYICVHNDEGAMGIVINRPLEMELGEILEHMQIPVYAPQVKHLPVFHGGPVEPERGFVLHRTPGRWDSMLEVGGELAITTSRDILTSIAKGTGPDESLVALGYAGWAAGQLERELAENAWLSGPADLDIIFRQPSEKRWQAAAHCIGVDLTLLSTQAGHS